MDMYMLLRIDGGKIWCYDDEMGRQVAGFARNVWSYF